MNPAYIGILIIAGLVMLGVVLQKQSRALDKERFERTNGAGVLEFASYAERREFDRRETLHTLAGNAFATIGSLAALFAVFLIIAGSMNN